MSDERMDDELQALAERYARRTSSERYSMLNADVCLAVQERQRLMIRLFARLGWTDLSTRSVLEVGCGAGGNLLELLRLGFSPRHLAGVELLADRYTQAAQRLPASVTLVHGDAATMRWPRESEDIVLQSTVFSSLLSDVFQVRLATAMWGWVKPGGGVLWYDSTVDNPCNPDVRGVRLARVRALFPEGRLTWNRVTLAPPIARVVCRVHPTLYPVLNVLSFLRTHALAWIAKPQK